MILRTIALLQLAWLTSAMSCLDAAQAVQFKGGQSMETECDQIEQNSSLRVEMDFSSQPGRVYVRFVNRTRMRLWFPTQQEPAFKPDEQSKIVTIWFGYFDEVYGRHRGDYVVPRMRLVPPGSDLKFELTLPALVQRLSEQRLSPFIRARVATKEIVESRTRGEQPLTEYLQHSCAIQSAVTMGNKTH